MKKEPDVEKITMAGTQILFILQNSFFLEEESEIKYVFDDCIKSYVGEDPYRRFINKHKKLTEPLLDANESMAYYASNFIPAEPDIYPITVEVAQKKNPQMLLDVVTLEVQYFFSVAVATMIKGHFKNKSQYFLPYFIQLFRVFAGWSKSGADKAWEHGSKRYKEYVDQLNVDQLNLDKTRDLSKARLGGLATKNILNIEDFFVSLGLTIQFYLSIKYYDNVFKNL